MNRLEFEDGSLLIRQSNLPSSDLCDIGFTWDARTKQWRAPASSYRDVMLSLQERQLADGDFARTYRPTELALKEPIEPRKHQGEALEAWLQADGRGVVSLPTGAGKTILAVLAIARLKRPTLICVPTIDLLHQWQTVLTKFFGADCVGGLGGGERDIRTLTVATYDSASLLIDRIGNQFGFLVCDECHHLPAPHYQRIGIAAIAPFRLGLSATVERADGGEAIIYRLLGEHCYEGAIHDLVDDVLAPYRVVSRQVALTAAELAEYQEERGLYLNFLRQAGVNMGHPRGWMNFVAKASHTPGGRRAMQAYRKQKRLAQAAEGKIAEIWEIMCAHPGERLLIFTDDNELAYKIGNLFLLPVITHQTKLKERKRFLSAYKTGEIDVLVTSKVLNEGVDVPEASIAIVVSGSGTVREHVQRLGRILRNQPGKEAILYELVAKGTNELNVNQRRRQHDAYQRSR